MTETTTAPTPLEVVAAAYRNAAAASIGDPLAVAAFITNMLDAAGYSIITTDALERYQEAEAHNSGRFTAKEVIKTSRDEDFYVGWSHVVEAPVWAGTRAEAIADGCPPSRLRRADETGTSIKDGFGCDWSDEGMIAEQRGFLPRANIAAYVRAYMEDRMQEAFDQLRPFDDATEVRRD